MQVASSLFYFFDESFFIMKVIGKIASWENLLQAYENARNGRSEKRDVMMFAKNLEENLLEIQHELLSGTYKNGRYHVFYICEPKKRMIMALPFKDRVVQWAIYQIVNQWIDKKMIYHSYACRVGKGQLRAAQRVQYWSGLYKSRYGDGYYLKMDISKYFYRVDHAVLLSILDRYYHDDHLVMQLFDTIINCEQVPFGLDPGRTIEDTDISEMRYDVGLPIGNLTSQMFANIYLNELDQFVKNKLKIRHYLRYMDDIAIFSNSLNELQHVRAMIELFAKDFLKLDFNNKTTIGKISQGITFVGCRIYPGYRKIASSSKKKMKKSLLREAKRYAKGRTTLEHANNVLMSYYGILSHVESDGLMRWISENFVLQKNRDEKCFCQKVRTKNEGIKLSHHAETHDTA